MYPTVDKLVLDVKKDGVYKIIPVKDKTYQLLCKVAKSRKYVELFTKNNPHLSDKINVDGIVIQDEFIKWSDMLEIIEVDKCNFPSDIAEYCKPQRRGASGPGQHRHTMYFYDYFANSYDYCGCGYTSVSGMWMSIFIALNKPQYVLIWKSI